MTMGAALSVLTHHSFRTPLATDCHTRIALLVTNVKSFVHCFIAGKHTDVVNHTGPSSELDSPTKVDLPALRKPEGQTYLFPTTPSSKLQPQRHAPSFTTPRGQVDIDFSSTGECESSPVNADSEETPDPPARMGASSSKSALVQFKGAKSGQKSSAREFFTKVKKPYTNAVARKRNIKRHRREMDIDVRGGGEDGEDRPSSSENSSQQKRPKSPSMGFLPAVLTFVDAHPNLPNTLSIYVQFFLNCFLAFCLMYILYGAYSTIVHDIDEKAMMESSEIFAEIALCAREFKENRCERDTRVPAMETVCNNWEKCMQRDPYQVGRSRLSAGMFAEIFNSFIEPISFKAIVSHPSALFKSTGIHGMSQIVTVSIFAGCFAVNNLSFGLYRAKHQSQPPPQQGVYMHHPPPPHMGYNGFNEHFYPSQIGTQSPSHGGYMVEEPRPSPTKRLGYRQPSRE